MGTEPPHRDPVQRAPRSADEIDRAVKAAIGEVYQKIRGDKNQGYLDRLQRARSWAFAATEHAHDPDIQFICYWIAMNALFGGFGTGGTQRSIGSREAQKWGTERSTAPQSHEPRGLAGRHQGRNAEITDFARKVCDRLDRGGLIAKKLSSLTAPVDDIVRDKWHFKPYYDAGTTREVTARIDTLRRESQASRREKRWGDHLALVLVRIEDLRDHIVHGAATYRLSKNRESLATALKVLAEIVPTILEVVGNAQAETAIAWPPVERPRKHSPQNPDSRV